MFSKPAPDLFSRLSLRHAVYAALVHVFLGFGGLHLEHARQDWVIADAHVRSIQYLEKGRRPAEDRYQLEVSYRVQARDVTARMNTNGHPSFNINDTISVKFDPDNSEHFVFNQPGRLSIAFLMWIAIMVFSLLWMRARRKGVPAEVVKEAPAPPPPTRSPTPEELRARVRAALLRRSA